VRCVVAPSFADIFYNNCFQNGLLPVALPAEQVRHSDGRGQGRQPRLAIDLESQTVTAPSGAAFHFDIDPAARKSCSRAGRHRRDPAGVGAIDTFEQRLALSKPWLEHA